MKLSIEKVSPTKAKKILEGNTMNRNLRPRVVENYARDMEEGRWSDAGDPIRINCDENLLLDGQHRLHAVIKSGKTIPMVIARGVPRISMLNIDTGTKRTFSDNLGILGYKNKNNLAAAIRWCVLYEDPERKPYRFAATNTEMMEWFTKHPRIEDATNRVANSKSPQTRGIGTILIALAFDASKPDFELFFHQLTKGEDIRDGDPVYALRRYVENTALMGAGYSKPPEIMHGITIKAWNAFIQGQSVRLLSYKPGGASGESFPQIILEA